MQIIMKFVLARLCFLILEMCELCQILLTRNSARADGAFLSVAVTLIFLLPDWLRLRWFEMTEIGSKKLTTEKLRTNNS